MNNIRLLDCTLRDGGYLNDWRFGYNNLVSIFQRVVDANVDIIEIGFIDERRPFDIERSIMPDTQSVQKIFGNLDKKNTMVVGMIDYGTCDIKNIQPCEESYLDGIRVIFKKHLMHEAMEYCRQLKAMGYKVFSQLVSIGAYEDSDLMELISLANDIKPYAVSMVDTYGVLRPKTLLHYYQILDDYLSEDIQIGFHSHNNFQLAYANDLAFLEKGRKHDILVDGTLFGMGKSAGNAPLELLALTLNDEYNKNYNINSMLEAIEESIKPIREQAVWGYQLFFYLCAKNNVHPNYLSQYNGKRNLSVSKVDELLSLIEPTDKKLLYDKTLGEDFYDTFVTENVDDFVDKTKLKELITNKKILVVGPGKNIVLQNDLVKAYIDREKPFIISVNHIISGLPIDMIFVTNAKRYLEMAGELTKKENEKLILLATSNIECRSKKFDFQINRAPLLEISEPIVDNSFLMLVKLLNSIGVKQIACAGMDGYSEKDNNYFDSNMEYAYLKNMAFHLNDHVRSVIFEYRKSMDIKFITYSAYNEEKNINLGAN